MPKPEISRATRPLTVEVESINEHGESVATPIAGEHPLTIYLDKREIVTLMTLGQNPEALVLGYLRNQRLVPSVEHIAAVQVDWETQSAAVTTRKAVKDLSKKMSKRTVTTGCGQGTVFGDLMEEIDSIQLRDDVRLSEAGLHALLNAVRLHETIYKSAGAVHGCALAAVDGDSAEILHFVEDVGRHNAVDTVSGWMALHGVGGADKVLYTTGRLTSEMVLKAARIGVPIVVSRNGVTAMGYDMALRLGMTLFGRAANRHFLCYSGAERFDAAPELALRTPAAATAPD